MVVASKRVRMHSTSLTAATYLLQFLAFVYIVYDTIRSHRFVTWTAPVSTVVPWTAPVGGAGRCRDLPTGCADPICDCAQSEVLRRDTNQPHCWRDVATMDLTTCEKDTMGYILSQQGYGRSTKDGKRGCNVASNYELFENVGGAASVWTYVAKNTFTRNCTRYHANGTAVATVLGATTQLDTRTLSRLDANHVTRCSESKRDPGGGSHEFMAYPEKVAFNVEHSISNPGFAELNPYVVGVGGSGLLVHTAL